LPAILWIVPDLSRDFRTLAWPMARLA